MVKASFIVFAVFGLALTTAVKVDKCNICSSDGALPQSVKLEGCESQPCRLKGGRNITVYFKVEREINELRHSAKGKFFGCHAGELDDTPANHCIFTVNNTRAEFPLVANEEYVYKNHFNEPYSPLFWTITVPSTLSLLDENKKPVFCYKMNVLV